MKHSIRDDIRLLRRLPWWMRVYEFGRSVRVHLVLRSRNH